MRRLLLTSTIAISLFSMTLAQGNVRETVDPQVAQLMKRFVETNKATTTLSGWRIQILATSDRQRMENSLQQFRALYPSVPADWVHAKPYYKIRAGAYATKRDALPTLYLLKRDFPAAYPIQDNTIKPEELLR